MKRVILIITILWLLLNTATALEFRKQAVIEAITLSSGPECRYFAFDKLVPPFTLVDHTSRHRIHVGEVNVWLAQGFTSVQRIYYTYKIVLHECQETSTCTMEMYDLKNKEYPHALILTPIMFYSRNKAFAIMPLVFEYTAGVGRILVEAPVITDLDGETTYTPATDFIELKRQTTSYPLIEEEYYEGTMTYDSECKTFNIHIYTNDVDSYPIAEVIKLEGNYYVPLEFSVSPPLRPLSSENYLKEISDVLGAEIRAEYEVTPIAQKLIYVHLAEDVFDEAKKRIEKYVEFYNNTVTLTTEPAKEVWIKNNHYVIIGKWDAIKTVGLSGEIPFKIPREQETTQTAEEQTEENNTLEEKTPVEEPEIPSYDTYPCSAKNIILKGTYKSITITDSEPPVLYVEYKNTCPYNITVALVREVEPEDPLIQNIFIDEYNIDGSAFGVAKIEIPIVPLNHYKVWYYFSDGNETSKKYYVDVFIPGTNATCLGENLLVDFENKEIRECETRCVKIPEGAECLGDSEEGNYITEIEENPVIGSLKNTPKLAEIDPLSILMTGALGTGMLLLNNWPLFKEIAPLIPGGLPILILIEFAAIAGSLYLWKRCNAPLAEHAEILTITLVPLIGDIPLLAYALGACAYQKLTGQE